jgi:pimeloyl-ACP methyl ester carboxylesterase
MATFESADGTLLSYHEAGQGAPLICVPGGPMQSAAYLGDLGGLAAHRSLVLLDLRGTGESAAPADPASYRCDRQVDDVEALRLTLGLETIDLLGHSAGAAIALLYATRYPQRLGRLVLVTPSPRVAGVEITDQDRREVAELRRAEPWFPAAFAAFERIWAGEAADADWDAIDPFMYGNWDAATEARIVEESANRNDDAAQAYYSDGAFDPAAVRAGLSHLQARTLLLAGGYDVGLPPKCAAEYAGLFPAAESAVQPRSGHYPWRDDAGSFVRTTAAFLS